MTKQDFTVAVVLASANRAPLLADVLRDIARPDPAARSPGGQRARHC